MSEKYYRPAWDDKSCCWCRFEQNGHQVGPHSPTAAFPHVLPPELFDLLTGGTYTPADFDETFAAREYATEEEAMRDLQQAIAAAGSPDEVQA